MSKLHNEYVYDFKGYSDTPKAVLAAIAFSFAKMIEGEDGDADAVNAVIRDEWIALYNAGIVPQKPKL